MLALSRYIFRQLAIGMVFVAAGLACALWLSQSLRYLDLIVDKGLSLLAFLRLTALLLPNVFVFILPISLFAVVLFTYNKLATDRELVVMRAAGLSDLQLARPTLVLALIFTAVGYLLTTWVTPESARSFREMRWESYNEFSGLIVREGVFNEVAQGLTVYVGERESHGTVHSILVHDKRDRQQPVTMWAQSGRIVEGPAGPRVVMENGTRQEVTRGTGDLSILEFDRYTLDLVSPRTASGLGRGKPREWTMRDLMRADRATLDHERFVDAKTELHQRLSLPLYNLAMALIALACLFSGEFSRRGQTGRMLLAVVLGVAALGAALGTNSLTLDSLARWPVMYLAPLGFIIASLMVLAAEARRPWWGRHAVPGAG